MHEDPSGLGRAGQRGHTPHGHAFCLCRQPTTILSEKAERTAVMVTADWESGNSKLPTRQIDHNTIATPYNITSAPIGHRTTCEMDASRKALHSVSKGGMESEREDSSSLYLPILGPWAHAATGPGPLTESKTTVFEGFQSEESAHKLSSSETFLRIQ